MINSVEALEKSASTVLPVLPRLHVEGRSRFHRVVGFGQNPLVGVSALPRKPHRLAYPKHTPVVRPDEPREPRPPGRFYPRRELEVSERPRMEEQEFDKGCGMRNRVGVDVQSPHADWSLPKRIPPDADERLKRRRNTASRLLDDVPIPEEPFHASDVQDSAHNPRPTFEGGEDFDRLRQRLPRRHPRLDNR